MGKPAPEQPKKLSIPAREEAVLRFWVENGTFEKSISERFGKQPFVFYDGPPFATGLPHYGHLLQGAIKDTIPRYQTMKGRSVRRVWGWDCHGLPIENLIEAELGLKHKKDIEAYGVQNFNEKARASVLRYDKEWKEVVPRMGRWVDMEHAYRTMDPDYTESIWWAFKKLYSDRLIYEGYKSMQLCPRCETTLSNSEVALGYKDVKDISVYVMFALVDEPGVSILAWTTTPWTLPGNVALAVSSALTYLYVEHKGEKGKETLVLAESRFEALKDKFTDPKIVKKVQGSELVGMSYTPVFDVFANDANLKNRERGWKVYAADFVSADDGTGIVHIAPAFGDDDMKLGERERLPFIQHVKMDGTIVSDVKGFAGMEVKPKGEDKLRLATDIAVLKYLQDTGTFFAKENITHSYPHCWRCDTSLLNYASTSWFVKVTAIKDDLIRENAKVKWVPEHIRDGRFGNWLENVRDWAISRTRYWGAPLPVWRCEDCKDVTVVGSLAELRANMSHRNTYTLMRHGESDSNAKNIISGKSTDPHHLTEKGKKQVLASAKDLKGKPIDLIYASPFLRTKESAELVAETVGFDPKSIVYDDRLGEINPGEFDCKPIDEYRAYFPTMEEKFTKRPKGGENLADVRARTMTFLDEIDRKYEGKHILIVTHEYDIWMLIAGASGLSTTESLKEKERRNMDFIPTGGTEELLYAPIPHNDDWALDFHRPYIDKVVLHCRCGGDMMRIPEVFDCWFESGSMPYAQFHYLGNDTTDAGRLFNDNFPADFIAEAVDQTRGWFYNMLVLSVGLFGKSAFKNVICTGFILAEDGQKMSKKLKNYPDVKEVVDKYGADALRLYMISSPVVRGENLNFSMQGIEELYKKVFLRTENVIAFYELYKGDEDDVATMPTSLNVLDRWIMARLSELGSGIAEGLDHFELDAAVRGIPLFVDDLSTWYLRRSRERLKGDDEADKRDARETLRYVLLRFAQYLAPITPFFAEDLYRRLRGKNTPESIHLTTWPDIGVADKDVIEKMRQTRALVSLALDMRVKAGINVRQPLLSFSIPDALTDEYTAIMKDEINVKEIATGAPTIALDETITPALKHEGRVRLLVRSIQEMRKGMSLDIADEIAVTFSPQGKDAKDFLRDLPEGWAKEVKATTVTTSDLKDATPVSLDGIAIAIAITRA